MAPPDAEPPVELVPPPASNEPFEPSLLLLQALNALYQEPTADAPFDNRRTAADGEAVEPGVAERSIADRLAHVPWLNSPEDSWL